MKGIMSRFFAIGEASADVFGADRDFGRRRSSLACVVKSGFLVSGKLVITSINTN